MRTAAFNLALCLDRLASLTPWCVYGLGCSLLANKLLRISDRWTFGVLAACWAAILLVFFLADIVRLRRRWYDPGYARAWLDLRNHAGGAVMAGAEDVKLRIRPRAILRPLFASLALPFAFLVAACVVPAREKADAISSAGVEKAIDELARKLETAAESNVLPEPDAEELRRQLEQLSAMAEKDPVAASEALSPFARTMDASMAGQLERHLDALERTASAAAAMEAAANGDGEAASALQEELSGMFRSLDRLAAGQGGLDGMSPELGEALSQAMAESGTGSLGEMSRNPGTVSPENMSRILEAMAGASDRLGESAQSLSGTGQGGAQNSPEPTGGSAAGGERLRTLSEALAEMSFFAIGEAEAGSGGIDQGGGATPLVFGAETAEARERFNYQPLPDGESEAPGMLLGTERSRPGEDEPEENQSIFRTGAQVRERVNAGQGAANLGPERARAAERYFEMLNGGVNAQ